MTDDILREANNIAQCRECQWFKSCTVPMRFTADDIRRQMEAQQGVTFTAQDDSNMQNLIGSMAQAVQNSMVEACPVFIQRLRSSPKLAERIKRIMQNWSDDNA
ncbi:hypothetical protein [Dehalogenimonas alkenigignens]|uniref:Uncharacterized protein n=1 Tax=Dehalogenimonas alkenigignens TaxID=1217799 RepID=A0A0W0GJ51_9CHLR|nr:hypothetical protein [Dehalogenimonas alkenigignens]KTB48586.1 hypothetical protein DEALK_14320 [Dehalogenimonas alkenigignens]PVV84974.1 hypothetical protein DD509_01360 [Dehalogenimonas alkenigignens]